MDEETLKRIQILLTVIIAIWLILSFVFLPYQ